MLLHPLADQGNFLIHLIVHPADPASSLTTSSDDTEATGHPQRSDCSSDAVDDVPPALLRNLPLVAHGGGLVRGEPEPLRPAPRSVEDRNTNQCGESRE
jgi:hypothetical protein